MFLEYHKILVSDQNWIFQIINFFSDSNSAILNFVMFDGSKYSLPYSDDRVGILGILYNVVGGGVGGKHSS